MELPGDGVRVLTVRDDVNQVYLSHDAPGQVSLWETREILADRFVELRVSGLEIVNLLLRWLLLSCMYPEWTSKLIAPFSAFESFEPMDQKRSPRLVHGKTHSLVISFSVKSLIALKDLFGGSRLLHYSSFDSQSELLEGILSLKSLAQTSLHQIVVWCGARLRNAASHNFLLRTLGVR